MQWIQSSSSKRQERLHKLNDVISLSDQYFPIFSSIWKGPISVDELLFGLYDAMTVYLDLTKPLKLLKTEAP